MEFKYSAKLLFLALFLKFFESSTNSHKPYRISEIFCQIKDCNIDCYGGDFQQYLIPEINKRNHFQNATFTDIINGILQDVQCENLTSLRIEQFKFPSGIVSTDWLNSDIPILSVEFVNSNIKYFEENAFQRKCFGKLDELILRDNSIENLYKNMFFGLLELTQLSIFQNEPIKTIDHDTLDPIANKLKFLNISANLISPNNLTNGCALLSALSVVNLDHNNFGAGLDPLSFDKLSLVNFLKLANCKITYLPVGIFNNISPMLKHLDLSNNFLSRLDWGATKKICHLGNSFRLYLGFNSFQCGCEFLEFLTKIQNAKILADSENVFCFYKGLKIQTDFVEYCIKPNPVKVVTMTSSNTVPLLSTKTGQETQNTTTENSMTPKIVIEKDKFFYAKEFITLKCSECDENSCNAKNTVDWKVNQQDAKFTITKTSPTSVVVSLNSYLNAEKYGLVWFSKATKDSFSMEMNHKDYGLGCQTNFEHDIPVTDLEPGTTYTFCLIRKDQIQYSPFNCLPYHVFPEPTHELTLWISNDEKIIVISLLTLGVILAAVLGALLVYCVVRSRPTILQDNKRIVPVKKNSTDVMILPRNSSLTSESKSFDNPNFIRERRSSTMSTQSNVDYVSPDLYEVIPGQPNSPFPIERRGNYYQSPDIVPPPRVPKRLSCDPMLLTPRELDTNISYRNFKHFKNIQSDSSA